MEILFSGDIKSFIHEGLLKERARIYSMFFIKRWFYRKKLKALEFALASFDRDDANKVGEDLEATVKFHEERLAHFTKFLESVKKKCVH